VADLYEDLESLIPPDRSRLERALLLALEWDEVRLIRFGIPKSGRL
jgi:hypothetical protein